MIRNNISTDLYEEEYLSLFEYLGLAVLNKKGCARPITFGSWGVFLRTLLANMINPILPVSFRQMLIFKLVRS
jgi:hypothetical protein